MTLNKPQKKRPRIAGFSLTELSVSMTIIALIAGSTLSVAVTSDFHAKKAQTESKLDRIQEALAGYLESNRRLPCPADGTLPSSNINFGTESITVGTPADVCSSNFNSGNIWAGVIPIRTLQLPDDFMFDGWGKRFSYVVDYQFANNEITNADCDGTTSTICFIDTTSGGITVQDDSGGDRTTTAIYVVFSHGQNAHGAFTKNGSSTRINAYAAALGNDHTFASELENSHFDASGTDTAYNATYVLRDYIATEGGGVYFDDIVRFKTKNQLVKDAGVQFFDSICRTAQDILDNPSSNACTGADDADNCVTFANEIAGRCLDLTS